MWVVGARNFHLATGVVTERIDAVVGLLLALQVHLLDAVSRDWGFDVRTRNGRDQLQCLIVFYDHQDPHLLKVSDHYSSRHDLVLVSH